MRHESRSHKRFYSLAGSSLSRSFFGSKAVGGRGRCYTMPRPRRRPCLGIAHPVPGQMGNHMLVPKQVRCSMAQQDLYGPSNCRRRVRYGGREWFASADGRPNETRSRRLVSLQRAYAGLRLGPAAPIPVVSCPLLFRTPPVSSFVFVYSLSVMSPFRDGLTPPPPQPPLSQPSKQPPTPKNNSMILTTC